MRVLIIGGTRFIGPYVVAHLTDMGHEVAVFNRGQTEADLPDTVKHIQGDRQRLADFVDEFNRFAPDVVLDMFPFSEQDARTVVNTFKGIARRAVAISSIDVYRAYGRLLIQSESGPVEPIPFTEDSPLRQKLYPHRGETPREQEDPMHWLDDYDKIPVEQIVMGDPDLPGTVLRLPMVYGPRDTQHRLFEHLKRMDDDRPAILLDKSMARWQSSRGYVENVAAAIALAVTDERAANRIYNVGEVDALSTTEWIDEIGLLVEWNGKVIVVPKERLPAHLVAGINTDQHMVVDTTRIREELGYEEHAPRDEALRRTIVWERAHPPENVAPERFDYAAEDALLTDLGDNE